jgi:hypothetical protein
MVEGMSGVQTGPGATPLTRTPRPMALRARERVKLEPDKFVGATPH